MAALFKAEAFEVELSAVQPPHNLCRPASQLCPKNLHLHLPTKPHTPTWVVISLDTGERVRKCMVIGEDNLTLERGNKYSKVPLSAKAVTGALYFPESPHQHKHLREQIPIMPSVVNFCCVK